MELRVENVLWSKNKKAVKKIYMDAFQKEEHMPFWLMLAMSCLWHTRFMAFYDGDTPCGLIYMASMLKMNFIMFFAVDENLRSKGYGSRILGTLEEMYPGRKSVLSIEPCVETAPNIDIRRRRKAFYGRNGYAESGYFTRLVGEEQEILVKNGSFSKAQFILFFMLYSNLTMYPKVWRA